MNVLDCDNMSNENKETGGAKSSTHAGEPAHDDLGNSSNGIPLNQSMTASDGDWHIQVPDEVVQGIQALFGTDREIGLSKATGFLKMGYMMAQSFGSVISTDQLQQVLDDGAQRLSEHGASWIEEIEELRNTLKKEMIDVQSEGNSKLAESLEEIVTQLDSAIKEIGNPKNTDSLPFVVAELVETKVAAALSSASMAQDDANDEQKKVLDNKLRILEVQHAKLVQALQSERESLREALGLQTMLDDSKDKSSSKGLDFEAVISEELSVLAGPFGDEITDIGELTDGIGTSKVGDHLVTVNSANQVIGKIVCESKAGRFNIGGQDGIVKQLTTAMTNYGAVAAIGIVNFEKAPVKLRKSGYLKVQSNIHLICVDWANDDYSGLEILYPIIRALVLVEYEHNTGKSTSVDTEAIITLCNENLTRLQDINKWYGNLHKQAEISQKIASEMKTLQSQLRDTFLHLIAQHREDSL